MSRLVEIINSVKNHVSRKKVCYRRAFFLVSTLASIPAILLGATVYYRIYQINQNQERIENYLRTNKAAIEKKVEQRFGIDIEGVGLKFVDSLPNKVIMKYNDKEDAITVARDGAYPLLERTSDLVITNFERNTTKGAYIHELGHDFFYQLKAKLEQQGVLHSSYVEIAIESDCIQEGIIDYLAVEMKELLAIKKVKNPKSLKEVLDTYYTHPEKYREIGRRIVKPILDKFGIEKGITSILKQPIITEAEIINPEIYQEKILSSKTR